VVVVHEVHVPVVHALVIGHVGIGGVDAHGLAQHLGERPAIAHQPIVDLARALLVTGHDALFQRGVAGIGGTRCGDRVRRHQDTSDRSPLNAWSAWVPRGCFACRLFIGR
jgi:hypothetical protein